MPAKETRRVLSSSGGADAEGRPVITPLSVLRCVDDANGIEFQTLAVDTVRITVNALWCAHWTNVALPVSRLFSHVPVAPALIRHWRVWTGGHVSRRACGQVGVWLGGM